MPARLPNLRSALRAVLLATLPLLLTNCGPERNKFAPQCPSSVILGDAADLTVYRASGMPGAGRDLTDLVLHGRIIGMQGTCKEGDTKDQVAVAVSVGVELTRGPAMVGQETEVPIFLAVTEGDTILDRRTYLMRVAFPSNVDRITLSPGEMNLTLPVTTTKSAAVYTVVAGFQLSPEQMMENRGSRGL